MVRYVFLDFDGVVMTPASYQQPSVDIGEPGMGNLAATRLDREAVARVNKLCIGIGAHVVLSTSWRDRIGFDGSLPLVKALQLAGLAAPVVGQTPHLVKARQKMSDYSVIPRGAEIARWLDDHCGLGGWSDTDIVILEDEQDCAPLAHRQVKTAWYGPTPGFTEDHLSQALRLFGVEP